MSEHKRKYLSGSHKRKLKEQKEVELAKCQKLSSFFSYIPSTSASQSSQNDFGSHTNNNEQNVEENLEIGIEEYKKGEKIIQYADPVIQEKSTEDKTNNDIIRVIEDFVQYRDLALWPDSINTEFVNNCLSKEASFFQNRKQDNLYIDSNKYYKDQSRQFSNKYFEKCLKNGQKLIRSWLCYSNSKGYSRSSFYPATSGDVTGTVKIFRAGSGSIPDPTPGIRWPRVFRESRALPDALSPSLGRCEPRGEPPTLAVDRELEHYLIRRLAPANTNENDRRQNPGAAPPRSHAALQD